MPEQEVKYTIKIGKEGSGATQAQDDLKRVDQQAKSTNDSLGGLTAGFGKLFAALGGIALINQSINAFIEAERSVGKLNAALKSSGQFSEKAAQDMKDLAGALADVTLYGDEAILNVIAKLIAMGAHTKDVDGLATAVLDLSTLMDKDLNRATLAMGQALRGEFGAFKQLGFQINEALLPSEQFKQVLEGIAKLAGGQAKAAVETMGGQYEQLKKQTGELKEAFGGLILATLGPLDQLTARLKAMGEWMEKNRSTLADVLKLASLGGMVQAGANAAFSKATPDKAGLSADQLNSMGLPAVALASANAKAFQFLPRYTATEKPGPTTPGLDDADIEAVLKLHDAQVAMDEDLFKRMDEDFKKREENIERLAQKRMDAEDRANDFEKDLRDEALLGSLEGVERERAQLKVNHEQRQRQIRELTQDDRERYAELMVLEDELHGVEVARFEQAQTFAGKFNQDLKDIAVTGQQAFAGGLATSIVDAFEQGGQAFQKFAANFLKLMAQMILQAIILRAIQGAVGGIFGGGVTPGTAGGVHAATGGQFRALAGGGMAETNGPVTMPRFGVLAGEAGRELLTVMAQPRSVNFNGLSARVGNVGGRAMAITDANDLSRAGGGAGGMIVIQLSHSPETEARIVRNSVRGAQVQITQDLGQDTPVSRGVKRVAT
jgi:hypothetical protein